LTHLAPRNSRPRADALLKIAFTYLIALICVLASLGIRDLLEQFFGVYATGATFFPSVLIATLFGGLTVGLFAAVLSTVCLWFFVLPSRLFPASYVVVGNLIVFGTSFVIVAILAAHYRSLRLKAEADKRRIEFMMQELRHRVKNILAVVQGMSRQIAKRSHDLNTYRDALDERLSSLGRTHDVLVRRNWEKVELSELISTHISVFNTPGELSMAGEVILLEPLAAEQLGIALYELASNCIKYGAWKLAGKVTIEWRVDDSGSLAFSWKETGAPDKPNNERQGFGNFMLTKVVPTALLGSATWINNKGGIVWELLIPSTLFTVQPSFISRSLIPREATIPTRSLRDPEAGQIVNPASPP
jgi:two-component sensor histidine kinase